MMRKKLHVVVLIVIVCAILCVVIERNKKTPMERYLETSKSACSEDGNTTVKPSEEITDFDGSDEYTDDKDALNISTLNKFYNSQHTVQYEVESYDIVGDKDITTQTQYGSENFYEGQFPDPYYVKEYTDFQAMRQDYPELDEFLNSNGTKGMSRAEYEDFLEEHLQDYTVTKHPETQYLFLNCRITNLDTKQVYEYINNVRVVAMQEDKIIGFGEFSCYFDCAIYRQGEDRIHNFCRYEFDPGESIECVIGCELCEDFIELSEDNKYYIGFFPIGLDDPYQFNAAIDDGFVPLEAVPREE